MTPRDHIGPYETKDPASIRALHDREQDAGPDALAALWDLSRRFAGVDLQFRRATTCSSGQWLAPWRARVVTSKNERAEYRVTVYADTASAAIYNLSAAVRRIDAGNQ